MSFTNWNVSKQISGNPTISMKPFCQPWREAVQTARGSLSNSTARMVAPIGPMPKKVTPMPWGKQTNCWYFHPVAKMTNSTTVAMMIKGRVRYEMRLLFNRCHGENPISCGAAEWGELSEFVELEFFINELCKSGHYPWDKRGLIDVSTLALPLITRQLRQLACQYAASRESLPYDFDLP